MTQTVTRSAITLGYRLNGPADSSSYGVQRRPTIGTTPLSISADSLNRHMCIFGRTGAGKSVTGMVIASELCAMGGVSVLVLDRTGEFSRSGLAALPGAKVLTPGVNLTISPFARRSDRRDDDVTRAVSLMHHFILSTFPGFFFTPYQERAFREALQLCYAHDSSRLSDIISQLEAQGEESRNKVKGWLEGNQAVISRLIPLSSGTLARVFDSDTPGPSTPDLFQPGLHIVNLGALESDEAKNMLSQVLCKLVMDHGKKLGETKQLRFVLMVDEAQHIAPSRKDYDGILEKHANELRKYGMGLVVIATRPTQVSENIIANCNTIICHSLTSNKTRTSS
jgi:DNA helicase HerA-like ATPase